MNICIPIVEDRGLGSPVSEHFGSAPLFMIVDSETGTLRSIKNQSAHHGHGTCQPLAALAGESLDALVVGGIGRGAIHRLNAASILVYLSDQPTVEAALLAFRQGTLHQATAETGCRHRHGHGHACGHREG
jgi:predicted Fe-Mo cluster-binding NifX family protein